MDGNCGNFASGINLAQTYPVNTLVELTLSPDNDKIRGLIYCTDQTSQSIVLKRSLIHTTLSSEITVINASAVVSKRTIDTEKEGQTAEEIMGGGNYKEELKLPLPNVNQKALEERERRAIRMAEESFSHINQKATPEGQKIFDKLLKACNEVQWRGTSIVVLKEIRVDPPYSAENCSLITDNGGLDAHSLVRVKKIVEAANSK